VSHPLERAAFHGAHPKQSFPSRPRYASDHPLRCQRVSVHSAFREFVGHVGLNCPGGGDVSVAAGLIAFLPFAEAKEPGPQGGPCVALAVPRSKRDREMIF